MTPYTTRSHSPTAALEGDSSSIERQASVLSNESSIDELHLCLKRLSEDQQQQICLQESPDGHVTTSTEPVSADSRDHVIPQESHVTAQETVRRASQASSSSNRKSSVSGEAETQQQDSSGLAEVPRPVGECGREEKGQMSDSGESSAPTSPARPSHHSLCTAAGPTLPLPTPPAPLLSLSVPASHAQQLLQPGVGGSSSGSGASPQSSLCSHSPSSPSTPSHSPAPSTPSQLSPSPSPAPPLLVASSNIATVDTVAGIHGEGGMRGVYETDQSHVRGTRDCETANTETQEDEWPDLHVQPEREVRGQLAEPPLDSVLESRPNLGGSTSDDNEVSGKVVEARPAFDTTSEVRGRVAEPHPQNAAAAYPHMLLAHPPLLQWYDPRHSAASYGYCSPPHGVGIPPSCQANFVASQTGLVGYYTAPPPGMWDPGNAPHHVHHGATYYPGTPNNAHSYPLPAGAEWEDTASGETPPTYLNEAPPTTDETPPTYLNEAPPTTDETLPTHLNEAPPTTDETPPTHLNEAPPTTDETPPTHLNEAPPTTDETLPTHLNEAPPTTDETPPTHLDGAPPTSVGETNVLSSQQDLECDGKEVEEGEEVSAEEESIWKGTDSTGE